MSVRALLVICVLCAACSQPQPQRPHQQGRDIALVPDTATVKDRVPARATLASLLVSLQLRADVIPTIIERTREVFDPRLLHAGHSFEIVRTTDGLLRDLKYEIDLDRFLRVAARPGEETTTVKAEIVPYKKDVVPLSVSGTISHEAPSLFAAMEEAGESPDLSLALADIFSGEVDFHTDLQPSDTFRVAVDRILREGEPVGYTPIAAAEFTNGNRTLRAVRFTPPGGKPGYYDERGRSLVRFFLASPLKFEMAPRVTSRFSKARFHPILKIFRPHLGVDYAAYIGAPVVAVATGVVVSAGYGGQGGNTVHLRHSSGWETYYMHLSSIAVRAGQHISQGQLIGRVGMTGMATGPHLDYRVKKGAAFVNPEAIRRTLPPGEPIPAASMGQFEQERDRAFARLTQAVPGK